MSASTTTTNNIGLSIKDIEKAAGSNSSSIFRKIHELPVCKNFKKVILCHIDRSVNGTKWRGRIE